MTLALKVQWSGCVLTLAKEVRHGNRSSVARRRLP